MEIKLKENSNLIIKNHNGDTLCSVDEATGEITGCGTKLYQHDLTMSDTNHIIIDNSSENIVMDASLFQRIKNSVKATYKESLIQDNGSYYDFMLEGYAELPELTIISQTVTEL